MYKHSGLKLLATIVSLSLPLCLILSLPGPPSPSLLPPFLSYSPLFPPPFLSLSSHASHFDYLHDLCRCILATAMSIDYFCYENGQIIRWGSHYPTLWLPDNVSGKNIASNSVHMTLNDYGFNGCVINKYRKIVTIYTLSLNVPKASLFYNALETFWKKGRRGWTPNRHMLIWVFPQLFLVKRCFIFFQ